MEQTAEAPTEAPEATAAEASEASTPEASTEAPADEGDPKEGKWFDGKPELNEAIAELAKAIPNLKTTDPEGLKTLRRMAEKDLYIKKLESERKREEAMTPLERAQREKPTEAPTQQTQQQPQQQTQQQEQPDVGANWRGWADIHRDTMEAWARTKPDGTPDPDFERLAAIDNAKAARQLDTFFPAMEKRLQEMIEQRFGHVMPHMQQIAAQREQEANVDAAVSELSQTEGFSDVHSLLKEDGGTIEINGETWAKTPYAEAVKEAPYIDNIRVEGRNQTETARLTIIAKLRAAKQVLDSRKAIEEQLRQASEAGQTIAQREQEGRVRHSLNAGTGTNQLAGGEKQHYVDQLLQYNQGAFDGF